MSPNCCGDVSPTFEKPTYREMEKTMEASRFVAQHVKNKDKFESVSIIYIRLLLKTRSEMGVKLLSCHFKVLFLLMLLN